MGGHSKAKAVVAKTVLFEANRIENLLDDFRREADYWSEVFPRGVKNQFSDTVLRPSYSALKSVVASFPFETGPLDLEGRSDLAVFPSSSSVEGRALAFYARTDLAFPIVRFLWSEAGWLDESFDKDPADRVARDIGEMLVKAVRLGSSFRAEGRVGFLR
jgi:hypothetical protein